MLKRVGAAVAAAGLTTALVAGSPAGAGAVMIEDWMPTLVVPENIPETEPFTTRYRVTTQEQWTQDNGTVVLKGDFNGDGRTDLFFYGAGSKPDSMWLSKLSTSTINQEDRFDIVTRTLSGTYKPFVGDFDGNGHDDIFWYGPGTAPDSIWYHGENGAIEQSKTVSVNASYSPIVANFDQNEQLPTDDILWYSATANETLWSGQTDRTFVSTALGNAPSNAQVLLGNWKPDNALAQQNPQAAYYPDVFFYVPGTGADAIWAFNGNGTMTSISRTVNGSYIPVVGNFDKGTSEAFGGLTDVFWYAPGKAADSVWINTTASTTAPITFRSVAEAVNASGYKPFVIPSALGPDTIAWNNPGGADFFWYTQGSKGNWSRTSAPMPADPGTRTPIVDLFDDATVFNESIVYFLLDRTNAQPNPYSDPETGELLPGVVSSTVDLPRTDVFWYGAGNTAGATELMWSGTRTEATFRTMPVEPIEEP